MASGGIRLVTGASIQLLSDDAERCWDENESRALVTGQAESDDQTTKGHLIIEHAPIM